MFRLPRIRACLVLGLAAALSACAGDPAAGPTTGMESIEGKIASIDTTPWTYDGNAIIQVETADRGLVPVELPARWNLCRAAAVDTRALAVGMRVRVVGAAGDEGGLVVCQDAAHRLVPLR